MGKCNLKLWKLWSGMQFAMSLKYTVQAEKNCHKTVSWILKLFETILECLKKKLCWGLHNFLTNILIFKKQLFTLPFPTRPFRFAQMTEAMYCTVVTVFFQNTAGRLTFVAIFNRLLCVTSSASLSLSIFSLEAAAVFAMSAARFLRGLQRQAENLNQGLKRRDNK